MYLQRRLLISLGGLWGLALGAGAGCEGAEDPDYTRSPGYQGPLGDPNAGTVQPTRPQRPRMSVSPTRLDLDPSDRRGTVRIRSTGARVLTLQSVELVPAEDWEVLLGEVDPRFAPEALTDPDGDGAPGLATDREVLLTVGFLGRNQVNASGTLVVRGDDPQDPQATVALRYTGDPETADAGAVADAGGADAGPVADAEPDAAPAECTADGDCAAVVELSRCQPCPVAAPASAVDPAACRVAFDEATPFFGYQPLGCLEPCAGIELTFCPTPPAGVRCDAGTCALVP